MIDRLEIEGGARLQGTVSLPGDKSISHRAVLLAAQATSPSLIRNLSPGADVAASCRLAVRLGASFEASDGRVRIIPGGAAGEQMTVDCGNSGTTMRLGAGLAAGVPGTTVFTGDESLSARPMLRVIEPLTQLGASIEAVHGRAPLTVTGARLRGREIRLTVPSAQVKGAVLLAALRAEGPTTVLEATPTRTHTEEMLKMAGAQIASVPGEVQVIPGPVSGIDFEVPADPSAAAFWLVAACICGGSRLRAESVYVGPGRDGFLDVLRRMGADLTIEGNGASGAAIQATSGPLVATAIEDPAEVAACIDELPVLMVAAACAEGTTRLRNAGELRLKESDRLTAVADLLTSFGVRVRVHADGIDVEGGSLVAARVDSRGDHRIAMAAAVAGLAASGRTEITGWDAVGISDPGFSRVLADVRIPG